MSATRPPALSPSAALRLPIIERHLADIRPRSVLEIGCGRGAMAWRLARRFDYRGYEPDLESFTAAADRIRLLGRGEVRNEVVPSSPDRQFDLVVAFEVLEHIEDDSGALRDWARWLTMPGSIILSVPAHPERFGPWDEAVGHFRRYTRSTLTGVLRGAGFDVVSISSWGMPVGYLLEGVRNQVPPDTSPDTAMSERTSGSGRRLQPPKWLGGFTELLMAPFALMQKPFASTDKGIGYVALCRLEP